MGQLSRLRVVVLHNRDFDVEVKEGEGASDLISRADVENAARDVARALSGRGHQVSVLAVPSGDAAQGALSILLSLRQLAPDLIFNLCESLDGDARHEALVPALLDLEGIPYTGSGPLPLGLALRKDLSKRLLERAGVPTPETVTLDGERNLHALAFPLMVKPTREDASVGISSDSVVYDAESLRARVVEIREQLGQDALVERYIEGRELYVSLIGNRESEAGLRVLPMHEIDFSAMPSDRPCIVSYEAKWSAGSVDYLGTRSVRARPLEELVRRRCEEVARAAFLALELRDYARIDLRLSADQIPYVIDVNPNCDLSEGAGVSRAASFANLSYADLIEQVCLAALDRHQRESVLSDHATGAHLAGFGRL